MKHWIKIQEKLVNLDNYKSIDEPAHSPGTPGYWFINAWQKDNTMDVWSFSAEIECKAVYKEITRILVDNYKFLE